MSTDKIPENNAPAPLLGLGLSEGLGLVPKRCLVERLRLQWPETPYHRDALHREAADEIERLRTALAKANDQAEHFERGWYLRGDALEQYANPLNWNEDSAGIRRVWLEPGSTTPAHYNGFEAARAALKA